jgi:hypothetical protein
LPSKFIHGPPNRAEARSEFFSSGVGPPSYDRYAGPL